MKRLIIAGLVGLAVCVGIASAQCVAVVNPTPGVMTDIGPVHNMAFLSSNNPIVYTTPTASPVLYFPGAKWIQYGVNVDAGYINLGPNFTVNGGCPKTWFFDPISSMQLREGNTLLWSAGPLVGGNVGCSDGDNDDGTCYFSYFSAGTARSPQIAVSPGEVLYAYDCFHVDVSGSNPPFAQNTPTRCGIIKLVIE